jgi:hypothetical protein
MRWIALIGFVAGCEKTVIYPTGEDTGCEESFFYADSDGDGYGDPLVEFNVCDAPPNTVTNPDDCDDADGGVHPAADELCDTTDRNCDGDPIGGAIDLETYYADSDADGWGDPSAPEFACEPPVGAVPVADDCDDADAGVNPGAAEICDGFDQDCDGYADEGLEFRTWYPDGDGDGWGGDAPAIETCKEEGSTDVSLSGDCDDYDATEYPGAPETLADGTDSDCDGIDGSAFTDESLGWENPRNVVAVATSNHFGLVTAADFSAATVYEKPGLMLTFDRGSLAFSSTVLWQNNSTMPYPIGRSVDAMPVGTDVYVGTSYFYDSSTGSDAIYGIGRWLAWDGSAFGSKLAYNQFETSSSGETEHLDHDLAVDSTGRAWVVGCGDESVAFFRIEAGGTTPWKKDGYGCDADSTSCGQFTGAHGSACWIDVSTSPETATACDGTTCTTWELDATAETLTEASAQTWSAEAWTDINAHGSWIAATDGSGGAVIWSGGTTYEVLTDYTVTSVSAQDDGSGGVIVAATVQDADGDGKDDVVVGIGSPDALATSVLPLETGSNTWAATSASAVIADGTVFVTAAGLSDAGVNDDIVAWAFYDAP